MGFQVSNCELTDSLLSIGNANAGSSYTRAVNALKDVEYEITADNALGLAKGDTKVKNIGKSSADKIKEFCQTGTMAKLEEKRSHVSS